MAENMSRADLEQVARERGVENPESFKNKDELIAAINAAAPDSPVEGNFTGDGEGGGEKPPAEGSGDLDPAILPINADINVSGDLRPSTGSAANPTANMPNPEVDAKMAELEAEIAKLRAQIVDPVTNQRPEDFLPVSSDLDERTQALVLGGRRASGVGANAAALNRTMATRANRDAMMERNQAAYEQTEEDNPLPQDELVMIDPATYRARMNARVQAQAKTLGTNTTIPGGAFIVNGELVNAFGDLIDESGSVLQKRSA